MNCHKDLRQQEKADFLSDFCHAMEECGHDESFRNIVVRRAVGKFLNAWNNREENGIEVYRSKEEKREIVLEAGGRPGKSDWFRQLGYSNTLTVPATVGGVLAKQVKEALEQTDAPGGYRTLVLEDGGKSIKSDLVRSNPFPVASCMRETCLICIHKPSGGKCWAGGITYSIECARSPCTNADIPTPTYVGESCRSAFRRGTEHLALYKNKSKGSFMLRHTLDAHNGIMGNDGGKTDFKMEHISSYKGSLPRIIEEAVLIQELEEDSNVECLNTKEEYYCAEFMRPCFPKGPTQHFQLK